MMPACVACQQQETTKVAKTCELQSNPLRQTGSGFKVRATGPLSPLPQAHGLGRLSRERPQPPGGKKRYISAGMEGNWFT